MSAPARWRDPAGAAAEVRVARAALATAGATTVGYQLWVVAALPGAPIVSFLSFFTTLSNVVAIAVLGLGAARPVSSPRRDRLRGASVLFILITFTVYVIIRLTTDQDLGLTSPWVNFVFHELTPVLVLVDWLLIPPSAPIPRATALRWLIVPIAYFGYSEVRGLAIGWYPYDFLNPGKTHGYSGVLWTGAIMLAVMALMALAIAWAGNRRVIRPRDEDSAAPGHARESNPR